MSYSVGFTLPDDCADKLALIPDHVWTPAYDAGGEVRDGAWVAEVTGLTNLPLHEFTQNQIWCAIVALACELTAWMQMLAFGGDNSHEARRWEPKRLRLRLFSTAARIACTGRRIIVHLARGGAWTDLLLTAITRLRQLAVPG